MSGCARSAVSRTAETAPAASSLDFDAVGLCGALSDAVPDVGSRGICVAYSGGLDSTALLAAAAEADMLRERLRAVHVHHGLVDDADDWARSATSVAADLGLKCEVLRVNVRLEAGSSLEEQARIARYAALAKTIAPGEVLLTAQHRDDQLETVLLQLFRGAGVAGLAAMPVRRIFGAGLHVRPLLSFSRADLRRFVEERGLKWFCDPANEDMRFDRSYLRAQVLPRLHTRWPAVAAAAARSAANCAEAQALLEERGDDDIGVAAVEGGLSTDAVARLSAPRQRNLLRRWIGRAGARMPSAARLNSIVRNVVGASADGTAVVTWDRWEVRRFRDRLLLLPSQADWKGGERRVWPGNVACLELEPGQGLLRRRAAIGRGIDAELFEGGQVEVGYRDGGERVRIDGKAHSMALSRLFQENRIFPWMRDRVPLVFVDGELVAIADQWIIAGCGARGDGRGVVLEWCDHAPIK